MKEVEGKRRRGAEEEEGRWRMSGEEGRGMRGRKGRRGWEQ